MTKVRLDKFEKISEVSGKNFLIRIMWYITGHLFVNSYLLPHSPSKIFLLKIFGAKIGKGVVIKPKVNIKYPWKLEIGDHVWIGENVWIDNLSEVVLSDHVCLSQECMLLTGNHNYKKETFDLIVKGINVHEGAWIGAKAVILPGSSVGTQSVVGVGAIAGGEIKANMIYAGNPAVPVRKREITS